MDEWAAADRRRPGKVTVDLGAALLDDVGNTVDYLSGPPYRLTIRALIERAVEEELRRLREEVLGGRHFPPREQDLRAGRPVS